MGGNGWALYLLLGIVYKILLGLRRKGIPSQYHSDKDLLCNKSQLLKIKKRAELASKVIIILVMS
jgi:hypothetical protein